MKDPKSVYKREIQIRIAADVVFPEFIVDVKMKQPSTSQGKNPRIKPTSGRRQVSF